MRRSDFRTLVPGSAVGQVARLAAPLSFWGGLDLESGCICDVSHPDCGLLLAGKIVIMPGARGSSSSSSALVEAARRGLAPTGIILSRTDPILVIGGLIAFDLYGTRLPILLADPVAWEGLPSSGKLRIDAAQNTQAQVTTA